MLWNHVTALHALRSGDLLELGMSANHLRHNLHPAGVVTYALREMAPSQIEVSRLPLEEDGSISLDRLRDIEHVSLDALTSVLAGHRQQHPEVTFQNLPISGHHAFAHNLPALANALPGLESIGLASIRLELQAEQPWPAISKDLAGLLTAAARLHLFASASITMGQGESVETRIDTIQSLRTAQQDSNAIHAVLLQVHHSNAIGARREEDATAVDYLKTLAVTRLLLDNVAHIQTDWSVMGPKMLELALRFGADDAGTVPRSQTGSAEPSHHGGESELRRIIRDAGFRPVERDAFFSQSLLH